MIFVTTGTTIPFDGLIKAVDSAVEKRLIDQEVICQIGNGSYKPKHCKCFTFKENIDDYIAQAAVIVTHGGTGTVISLLRQDRPFVAVANPMGIDDHQVQFLTKMSSIADILWTDNPLKLPALIKLAESRQYRKFESESLLNDLKAYILRL